MALPGTSLMRLKLLSSFLKYFDTGGKALSGWNLDIRCYAVKARCLQEQQPGSVTLSKEFPDPKTFLNNTISRSLGVSDMSQFVQYSFSEHRGLKKATVTVLWPCKFEMEGVASSRVDAERVAATAACVKLKELGVIGPDNRIPRRATGRGRGRERSPFFDVEEDALVPRASGEEQSRSQAELEENDNIAEALRLFPQSKSLLARAVQVATSCSGIREFIHFRTSGGKLKKCELTLKWPENMTFSATARNRVSAEKTAAALACMKLKELGLLSKDNIPLSHAEYHREMVREAGARERLPFLLEVPGYMEDRVRDYLSEYPAETDVLKYWEEQEAREQQALHQEEDDEDDDLVTDAITGQPYRPLSPDEAERFSLHLQDKWRRADPQVGVELPVDAHRQRVVSAVQASRVVVIAGETGCGKTTRIPRFLLEERVKSGEGAKCNILVTQPRRISAVSVAHRVAEEMGPELKRSVGYQVRLESRPPDHSGGAMLFLTVGVLLRKLQGNPYLQGISHVVVDEVHERDINTDLLLALLCTSLAENPDLRVVLMSATGDNQRLARYFGGCPIVKVPGFMHPVRDRYLEDVLREMGRSAPLQQRTRGNQQFGEKDDVAPDLDLVADVIQHIDAREEAGAVLCFLPGWQEIKAVQEKLEGKPHFSSHSLILPLHSSMSVSDQQKVFQRPQVGQRKIVLATNIAETSITIDDVVHVVDVGTHKQQSYDQRTKVSCLDTVWVSRSNVTQRKGRAGRCQPGWSYHLFSRDQLESMTPFPIPEILRTPLESLVMQAKIHSPNSKAVDFLSRVLDSPEKEAVRDAVRNLQDIGVLDESEALTPLGERVACMSCDPRLGKVLVLGVMFRCVLPLLSVAGCLTRDPFHNSLQNRALIKQAKKELSDSTFSDYLVLSRAMLGWRRVQREGTRDDREDYLQELSLSRNSLRFINGLMSQFSENLHEADLVSRASECQSSFSLYNEHSKEDELLQAVLLAGLYPNLIQVKRGIITKGGRFRPNDMTYRTRNGPVVIHRSSVNRGREKLPSRWMTFFSAVKSNGSVFIRDSSLVHPLALLLLTDCNVTERVTGERVQVSFPGCPLVRCELSAQTWELLWDLRTSIQTMLYRNLSDPDKIISNSAQDAKILSLLVELLKNTNANPHQPDDSSSDSEVD